jgi:hypothetical protein
MSLLCWNCRGLGQPRIVQELVRLVRELSPKIVFISETRQQATRVNNLKNRLAMDNCFLVDGKGKGGGLALYWDNSIKFSIVSYTMHHIDTLIWDGDHHASWRGTFAYGEPRVQDRHKLWKLLERLKPCSSSPWLVIGDFNEVMWNFEHFLLVGVLQYSCKTFWKYYRIVTYMTWVTQGCHGLMITNKPKTAMSGLDWIERWPHQARQSGSLRFVLSTLFRQALITVPYLLILNMIMMHIQSKRL